MKSYPINANLLLLVVSVASTTSAFSPSSFTFVPSRSVLDTATFVQKSNISRRKRHEHLYASSSLKDDSVPSEQSFDPFNIGQGGKISPTAAPTSTSPIDTSHIVPAVASTENQQGGLGDVWKARLLLIVAAALYGTNFTCVKLLDDTVPVGISTTLRFALAALATLPWLLAPPAASSAPAPAQKDDKDESPLKAAGLGIGSATASVAAAIAGLEVGAYNSVGYIAQAIGLETTDASKSAFICSLAVVIVPILDFMAGKKLLPREMVGAAMAVAGVGFLELGGAETVQSISTGDLITLMQPLAFGMAFWRMEHAMHKYPEEAKRLTAAQIFAVFLSSAVYGQFLSGDHASMTQIVDWVTDPMILGALFWTGCITTALTVYMETLALKTLSAAETTMIFSTEPLWGAAFASVVVGEQLGLGAGVGAALILGGCLFSNMGSFDWIKNMGPQLQGMDKNSANKNDELDQSSNNATLPKALLGPGLSIATPAVAVAKIAADMANDPSTSAIGDAVRDTLGDT